MNVVVGDKKHEHVIPWLLGSSMMVGFWAKLQEYKLDEVYQSSRSVIGKMTYFT